MSERELYQVCLPINSVQADAAGMPEEWFARAVRAVGLPITMDTIEAMNMTRDAAIARVAELEAERDKWRDEAKDRFKRWRKTADALHALSYPAADIDVLRAVAAEIDCMPGCEYGYTEYDTGAFVCSRCEKEPDCFANAEHLRELANALEARAALQPKESEATNDA